MTIQRSQALSILTYCLSIIPHYLLLIMIILSLISNSCCVSSLQSGKRGVGWSIIGGDSSNVIGEVEVEEVWPTPVEFEERKGEKVSKFSELNQAQNNHHQLFSSMKRKHQSSYQDDQLDYNPNLVDVYGKSVPEYESIESGTKARALRFKGNGNKENYQPARQRQRRSLIVNDDDDGYDGDDDGWHVAGNLESETAAFGTNSMKRSRSNNNWHNSIKQMRRSSSSSSSSAGLTTDNVVANSINAMETMSNTANVRQIADECKKLLVLWTFLKASYPSLASHLFLLSSELQLNADGNVQTVARLSHNVRSLIYLLEQADKSLRGQQLYGSSKAATHANNNGWLSRVSANPNYAKLISRLQQQQQRQQLLNNRHNSEQITSSANQDDTQAPQTDNRVYGRIAHYPHELEGSSNSAAGEAGVLNKALDKLHQLNEFVRNQHQPASEADELETNKIPHSSASSADAKTDQTAKSKVVYGSIMHRPSQKGDGHQSSITTLRQLNGQISPSSPTSPLSPTSSSFSASQPSLNQQQQQQLKQQNADKNQAESYGRILMSPPSLPEVGSSLVNGDNQRMPALQHNKASQASRYGANEQSGWNKQLTLDKLKHQLESSQWSSGRDAAFAPNEDVSGRTLQADFEGTWHSNPLDQVEVRQLNDEVDSSSSYNRDIKVQPTAKNVFNLD